LDNVGNGNPPIFTDKKKYSHCSSDILGITEDKSIVLFTAKWSGPDRKLLPIINDLLNSYSTITLYVMDVDEKREEAKLCNITGMPTLLYFNSGVIRGVSKGLMPKEELERYFKEYL
jgi:thioredoxin-like negative regulator of GroEL